jgi:glyoxylate/hydroxypyruvate reductase A
MRILIHTTGSSPDPWIAEILNEFPDAQVRAWHEGDNDPADYAIVWKPPLAMLQQQSGLKAVFNIGAGVDAILQFGDALPKNLTIVRLDDAGMGMQMAEYVTHAVLRYFRRLNEFETQARAGQWRFLKPHDKKNFSVGILGLGVLGTQMAQALAHFGFPINGWSRTRKEVPGVRCYSGPAGLDEFLRLSRVLVCVLPLTDETAGLLNETVLGKLPQGAYLINVARGAHLVEDDLLKLVQNGHIAAATLDVFRDEPLPPAHPFWQEPKITITPHIAALTLRGDSVRQIAGKIRALERGEPIAGVVDRTRGY